MSKELTIPYAFLLTAWICNINDLIRPHWFYKDIKMMITINFLGILALWLIIKTYKDEAEKKK